jgi:hypothetical protein
MSTPNAPQSNTNQPAPKGPSAWSRAGALAAQGASSGWESLQGWRKARKEASKGPYATVASGVKDAFVVFVGAVVPFGILVILTISAGYYFNSLRDWDGDTRSIIAYGSAAIIEFVNLALFFVSSKAFWSGKPGHFVTALIAGLALTVISVVAQVLYLSNNIDRASLGEGANLLEGLPIFGSLASTSIIIVTRALALHVAEFACCYVVARSAVSHKKIMQANLDQQQEQIQLAMGRAFMQFMNAKMLEAGVQVTEEGGAAGNGLIPFPGTNGASNGASASNGHGRKVNKP